MPGKKGNRTRKTPRHEASYPQVLRAPPDQFYIKRPPSDLLVTDFPEAVPNLYAPVMEREYFKLAARLRKVQKEYRRTGNGMYLLSAFLMTHELGLYPPQWALDAVVRAFKAYWQNPTSKSLDRLLQLEGGRGESPGFKAAARREGEYEIAHDMWFLEQKFGLTVNEAAEVLEAKLKSSPKRKGRWGETVHHVGTQESLAKQYSSTWKKAFGLTKAHFETVAPGWTDKDWIRFTKSFPTTDLHGDVKAKLRVR